MALRVASAADVASRARCKPPCLSSRPSPRCSAQTSDAASYILFGAGALVLLAVPLPFVTRSTYMDENAVQPAQVNTYWSWGEVQHADALAADVERWIAEPSLCALGRRPPV